MQSVMDTPSRGVCERACGLCVYVCEDVGVRVWHGSVYCVERKKGRGKERGGILEFASAQ